MILVLTRIAGLLLMVGCAVCQDEEFNTPDTPPPPGMKIVDADMIVPSDDNRNLINDPSCRRWPNGEVPYVHDGTVSNFQRVLTAMRTWERHTCIRFRDIGGDSAAQQSTIHVRISTSSCCCRSTVGRFCLSQQNIIQLAPGCQNSDGTPVHELAHTLGLYHEQSRTDRDNFVTIVNENIRPDARGNFAIATNTIPLNQLDVPYDYYSDMHYPRRAFSRNGLDTIITTESAFQDVIGKRIGPSFYDIKKINEGYNCARNCPAGIRCRLDNDCFINSNCKCVCKDRAPAQQQYGPNDPQTVEDPTTTTTNCGSSIILASWFQSNQLSFPTSGGMYPNNANCIWTIRNNAFLFMTRVALYVSTYNFGPSCADYMSVNPNGGTSFSGITKTCGSGSSFWIIPAVYARSNGRDMSILFRSDASGTYSGFRATVATSF